MYVYISPIVVLFACSSESKQLYNVATNGAVKRPNGTTSEREVNISSLLFSLLHVVPTGSGVHPTSYPIAAGVSFPEVKRPGREADHSPPNSAEVNKTRIYTSTTLYALVA
jgi:hypothetical protein